MNRRSVPFCCMFHHDTEKTIPDRALPRLLDWLTKCDVGFKCSTALTSTLYVMYLQDKELRCIPSIAQLSKYLLQHLAEINTLRDTKGLKPVKVLKERTTMDYDSNIGNPENVKLKASNPLQFLE